MASAFEKMIEANRKAHEAIGDKQGPARVRGKKENEKFHAKMRRMAEKSKKASGFDSKKRWGNSAMKGHGVNSPAMMEARAKFNK